MRNRKWLLAALVAVPLAGAALLYGPTLVRADAPQTKAGYVCPLTGQELPCPNCCPLIGK